MSTYTCSCFISRHREKNWPKPATRIKICYNLICQINVSLLSLYLVLITCILFCAGLFSSCTIRLHRHEGRLLLIWSICLLWCGPCIAACMAVPIFLFICWLMFVSVCFISFCLFISSGVICLPRHLAFIPWFIPGGGGVLDISRGGEVRPGTSYPDPV